MKKYPKKEKIKSSKNIQSIIDEIDKNALTLRLENKKPMNFSNKLKTEFDKMMENLVPMLKTQLKVEMEFTNSLTPHEDYSLYKIAFIIYCIGVDQGWDKGLKEL